MVKQRTFPSRKPLVLFDIDQIVRTGRKRDYSLRYNTRITDSDLLRDETPHYQIDEAILRNQVVGAEVY